MSKSKEFAITEKLIRRVTRQFNIADHKRGPKPRQQVFIHPV